MNIMQIKLTKEDILKCYNSYQLEVKRKYLLDLLFFTPALSSHDRIKINDLLLLVKDRYEYFREEQSA